MKNKFKAWKFSLIGLTSLTIVTTVTSCKIGDIGEVTPDEPTSDNVKVTFDPNGGKIEGSTETKYCYVEKNAKFSEFAHPLVIKDDFQFDGWMDQTGHVMTSDDVISDETTLTAQWIATAPDSGNKIICTIEGQQWEASNDSICSDSKQIHLTSIETNAVLDVERSDFNASDVTIGQDITILDSNFLYNCQSFTGQIRFAGTDQDPAKLVFINEGFMAWCSSFNSPIMFPSSVSIIGQCFLAFCSNFDSQLNLSNVVGIADDFMAECISFKQPLTIPSTVTFVSNSFMNGCNNFVDLTVNTDPENFVADYISTLVVVDEECPAAKNGVTIRGTYKQQFFDFFDGHEPITGIRNLKVE